MKTLDVQAAYALLNDALMNYQGRPVGTVAALDPDGPAAVNYDECFIRDFIPAALVFLNDGRTEIVRNFLDTVLHLRTHGRLSAGHETQPGVMPASFKVVADAEGTESLVADFGERAIGRVAPVDSMMWWMLLLHAYAQATGDTEYPERREVQRTMREIMELCLRDAFEVFPTLLVPDGSFMIDRRLGVYGHPLEIQTLFYGALQTAGEWLRPAPDAVAIVKAAMKRKQTLRTYVRIFYWLDLERLNEIHRFSVEEFGTGSVNMLNINPDSIPPRIEEWFPEQGGFFVGNLGPGRMDFRFFAQGNLLSVLFGLATEQQARELFRLYDAKWDDLVGHMPVKICYPALEGAAWHLLTGSDPKNVPWSYHNGGNWPALLWPFVAAALRAGRRDLAERACDIAGARLLADQWPEYYDGKKGRLLGRRANINQIWSASSYILARQLLEDESRLDLFPRDPGA